nr:hypothetical protein KPHV_00870 [Kitasatospora purpeofusca]
MLRDGSAKVPDPPLRTGPGHAALDSDEFRPEPECPREHQELYFVEALTSDEVLTGPDGPWTAGV